MKKLLMIVAFLLIASITYAGTLTGITATGVSFKNREVATGNLLDHSGNFLVTHTGDNLIY